MEPAKTIDHFNLWSFDLNLLVVFDALMKDRSVTQAATRLKIQQPAMSHNLSTLRVLLQDELFVRVGQIMQPTPRAHALAAQVAEILGQAQRALVTKSEFRPEVERRIFRIGFSSELEVILIPELTAVLRASAPGISLLARPANPDQIFRMLDDGVIDLGVGCYEDGAARHRRHLLFEQSLMCCYDPVLLGKSGAISREEYLEADHALVSQKDSIEGCIDVALRRLNVSLKVAMAAPEFLTVLTAVTRSGLVATLPTRIVRRYAPLFGLEACPVPLNLEVSPISMVWSAHSDRDPASGWLRDRVFDLLAAPSHGAGSIDVAA